MRIPRCLLSRRPTGDDGVGLVLVVSCMLIASIFALASLGYALNTQRFSRTNQDWNGALAAAQAGVDDYIGYLNRNDNYERLAEDCTNIALRGPRTQPNACPWTSTTPVGWKPFVAGEPEGAAFHYDINAARLESDGVVLVTSTGRARTGGKTRTIEVGVGRGGSTQFLYYTDHEDADPDNKQVYSGTMDPGCVKYWWQPTTGRDSSLNCKEITFIGGDVLDGPVHVNDTPLFTTASSVKPKFLQGLETSDPKCKLAVPGDPATYANCDRTGQGDATSYPSGWPAYADVKDLVDNGDAFRTYPGCQYAGATRIKFQADGSMRVWSKESVTTPACGGSNPDGATVSVPVDQVIYVKGGTSGAHLCRSQEIGDGLPLGTYTGDNTMEYDYDLNMTFQTQYCGQGNAYVEGTLKGRVTLATANFITVTGDLVMAGGLGSTDMLGLVAANSVEVFHPWVDTWKCKNSSAGCTEWEWDDKPKEVSGWPKRHLDPDSGSVYPNNGVQITASIQTLLHSFTVQSYNKGTSQGQLYVKGSIAQRWRGIVGQSSPTRGYLKQYSYDKRLRYAAPPYFPQWTNAVWAANYSGEVVPRY